jgi:hypothetical protein
LVNTRPLCCKSFRVEEAHWAHMHNLTGHVFGSCWVCQRMRTHSGHVIAVAWVGPKCNLCFRQLAVGVGYIECACV